MMLNKKMLRWKIILKKALEECNLQIIRADVFSPVFQIIFDNNLKKLHKKLIGEWTVLK